MEITRTRVGDSVQIDVAGRLDGYWCDHLNTALTEVLREGNHHIRVDCSQVSYLTSAGIGVLMRFYKEAGRIHGTFQVVNPSAPVSAVLRVARLEKFLVAPDDAPAPVEPPHRAVQRLVHDDVSLDVFDLDSSATLTCRAVGTAVPLTSGAFEETHCTAFASTAPTFAIGVGAFGASFFDCRSRFGELLSVAGATAYQPGDGTNVADYLVAGDGPGADVHVLYCLACEGRFSHLVRFETPQAGGAVGLSRLLNGCFEATAADSLGVVVVAEVSGLVGAALRRAPTERLEGDGFFAHPGVRSRLTFTTERAFPGSVVLAAGVVHRNGRQHQLSTDQLRPIGPDYAGHFHGAAFRFRPIRKGAVDLTETVTGLFEPEQLLGVLHLLHDDRSIAGSGESEFVRGACWIAPITGHWPTA